VGVAPWTDDYSNIASALIRHYRKSLKNRDDQAIEYFSAVIAKFPDMGVGYKRRADAYLRKRNYKRAIDDITALMALGGHDIDAYKIRGMAHQFDGNDLGAIEDLTVYLSKKYNDVEALELRAVAYGNIGQREKAIADFRGVLFLNPSHRRARHLLGRLGGSP